MTSWKTENNWWLNDKVQSYIQVLVFFAALYLVRGVKFRYYFVYGCYISLTIFTSLFYIPIFMVSPKNPANIVLIKPIATLISKIVGIQWELRGADILAVDRAGVLVGNHQSLFDALGIGEIAPHLMKCVSISRKEIFYYWPFGLSAWLGGVVFIDRYNGKSANRTLLDTCSVLLKHKAKLVIFPEGTRNRKGDTLLPFKKGAFRVAISAQIPILPIVFSPYYFISSDKKLFNGGRMIIKTLDPIPTTGLTEHDLDMLIEKTWSVMADHYKQLKAEIYKEINN